MNLKLLSAKHFRMFACKLPFLHFRINIALRKTRQQFTQTRCLSSSEMSGMHHFLLHSAAASKICFGILILFYFLNMTAQTIARCEVPGTGTVQYFDYEEIFNIFFSPTNIIGNLNEYGMPTVQALPSLS